MNDNEVVRQLENIIDEIKEEILEKEDVLNSYMYELGILENIE